MYCVGATLTYPTRNNLGQPAPPRQRPAINRHEQARMWDAVIALLFAGPWSHGNTPSRYPVLSCPVSVLQRNPGHRKCKAVVPSIRPTISVTNWGTSTIDRQGHLLQSQERIAVLPAQGVDSSPKRADRTKGRRCSLQE
jgi:hypothetical protein